MTQESIIQKEHIGGQESRIPAFFRRTWTFFVGLLLLCAIPVWHFFVAPELLEISEDFSYTADIVSFDNFFDPESGTFIGEKQSKTVFSLEAIAGDDDDVLEVKHVFDVRTLSGKEIFSVTRTYGVDAHTGAHIEGVGDRSRTGYLFAPRQELFTLHTETPQTYIYWHVNYDTPVTLNLAEEFDFRDLHVSRYEASFTADQTEELSYLPDVGETKGIVVDVDLSVTIEPISGYLISYEDSAVAYYYDLETGDRLHPWNAFSNHISGSSEEEHYLKASLEHEKIHFVGEVVPIGIFCFAILFLFQRTIRRFFGLDSLNEKQVKTYRLPVAIFFILLLLTFSLWQYSVQIISNAQESQFTIESREIMERVLGRLDVYTNTLRGGVGLFEAFGSVNRSEWRSYVNGLNIQQFYPGIQGIGYTVWIEPEELEGHIETVRAEGFPDYRVHPEGVRPEYSAILYLEPFDTRNQQAFGFDMFQESTRRAGMTTARNTGTATLSGKVTLVQEIDEDVQAGFLIYLPRYSEGTSPQTVEERKEALEGFVYSPFRMNNFIQGALPTEQTRVNLEIFDGADVTNLTEERRMFGEPVDEGKFENVEVITFGNHSWTLRFSAPDAFDLNVLTTLAPVVILISGSVVSLLTFGILLMFNRRRLSAMRLAEKMTEDLKRRTEETEEIRNALERTNKTLTAQKEELSKQIEATEAANRHMVGREERMIALKKELRRLREKSSKNGS